ncbi:hypothetical protein FQN54_002520 [Arachnomyces sp. PD_36]|nr:hypothetical protein FQN54_002520 [Arachnomyces sp. PD_36]
MLIAGSIALIASIVGVDASAFRSNHASQLISRQEAVNRTADSANLKTWWHISGEINTETAVANENVRQSHLYSIQVASSGNASDYYDSFAYETIPRSGKGKLCHPDDPNTICEEDDGVSIEDDIGANMAWTQFLYGSDVVVKVSRPGGEPISDASDIVIRPTNLEFSVDVEDGSALISVPYTPDTHGIRLSVEFADDIWEYRRSSGSQDTTHYVQNVDPSGDWYVESYDDTMPIVGREPVNALLIFASPFPSEDLVPAIDEDTYEVQPGLVTGLDSISQSVVYFGPGVYYFTGTAHGILSSTVSWVYLAPGAYVKGAMQYNKEDSDLLASGFGVLSGEQYVYQANTAENYSNIKSDETSLKMWRGEGVTAGQKWTINGLTTNAQPFNGMDFYGDTDGFTVDVSDYKQVGSFFSQTDGLQMYPGSYVRDVFYHIGDDGIKTYHSNVNAERFVVWKTNNAPIIQMGWYARDIGNITINQVDVIHCRYNSYLDWAPRALIGSSSSYLDVESTNTADTSTTISDYTVSNIRAEGLSPGLISLNMLSNINNFVIENAWIEEFVPLDVDVSAIRGFTDKNNNNAKVTLGANSEDGIGLRITNYIVGDEQISFDAGNWNASSTGKLSVDADYEGSWTVE